MKFAPLLQLLAVVAATLLPYAQGTVLANSSTHGYDWGNKNAANAPLAIGTDFEFLDNDGRLRTVSSIAPNIAAIFFGYSNCPDICAGTLAKLTATKLLLGEQKSMLRVVFVTVDPVRDTRIVLNSYLSLFGKDFIGARLTPDELHKIADKFAVSYHPVNQASGTVIGHSSGIFLFNKKGRPAKYLHADTSAQELADTVAEIIG